MTSSLFLLQTEQGFEGGIMTITFTATMTLTITKTYLIFVNFGI